MYDESLCVPGLLSSAIFYCLMGGYRLHGSSLCGVHDERTDFKKDKKICNVGCPDHV